MVELFEVEQKYGSRIDHISSIGKCKQRIDAITSIEDNPFVLVLNIQIPGDPPVSIVSYFVIPPDARKYNASSDHQNYIKLLDKFLAVPMTEKARLAEWGIEDDDDDDNNTNNDTTNDNQEITSTNANASLDNSTDQNTDSANTGHSTSRDSESSITHTSTNTTNTAVHSDTNTKSTYNFDHIIINMDR